MKKNEKMELLKKCFGKQKDDRYHAIAMLILYGIFILVIIIMIRVAGTPSNNDSTNTPDANDSKLTSPSLPNEQQEPSSSSQDIVGNDINYSYSYTILYNGTSEVYLGKKVDNKEKFTLIKDGGTTNYAILDDNYLILENNSYHITNNPSEFFKYCDVEAILLAIENAIPTQNQETIKYQVSNKELSVIFHDTLLVDNEQNNSIQLSLVDQNLKYIDLDISNYISAIKGESTTVTIHMEFVDIGTTEDFEIPLQER